MKTLDTIVASEPLSLSKEDLKALLYSAEQTQSRIRDFCKVKRSVQVDDYLATQMQKEKEQWIRIVEYLKVMIASS